MSVKHTRQAMDELSVEVERRFDKWGIQNHPPEIWLLIIAEELGEVANARLRGNKPAFENELFDLASAAMCAIIEGRQRTNDNENGEGR